MSKLTRDQRFLGAASAAGIGFWDWSAESDDFYLSSVAAKLVGATEQERESIQISDLKKLHPSDLNHIIENASTFTRSKNFEAEYRVVEKNGDIRWLNIKGATYRGDDNKVHRVSGSLEDITQRKTLEQNIKNHQSDILKIIEASPYPMIVTRIGTGELLYRNENALRLFNIPEGEVGRFRVEDFTRSADQLREFRDEIFSNGKATKLLNLCTGSGHHFRGEVSAKVIEFAGFKAVNIVIKDLESNLQNEERLEKARQAAEIANQHKSGFLAVMSHEIRTPMNGVLGVLEILRDKAINDEQRQLIDVIEESGSTLLHIVDDILDFAKLESGKMQLEYRPIDPGTLLLGVRNVMLPSATQKGLTLELLEPEYSSQKLMLDGHRLRQVLMNLVGNAIKFTDNGHVKISYSIDETFDHELTIRFCVADSGAGISKSGRASLFKDYQQGDRSISRRYGGTGLGLAISQQLVHLMGGTIGVNGPAEGGSAFWFEIPIQRQGNNIEELDLLQVDPTTLSGQILVAEDNPVNQLVISGLLDRTNLEPRFVNNGQEALEALKIGTYDAILMDIQMPVMDGMEAARVIRKSKAPWSTLPIIALTANALSNEADACIAAGMDAVIRKPIVVSELFRQLAHYGLAEQAESA